MSWTAYRLVFRLLTPVHIGAAKLGNLQTARQYVHGKALWGALTARLTRDYPELGGDYVAIGRCVNDELAFSYFYPAVGEVVDLWPWDDPDRFAWRYLGSYASTALDYGRNTAEEGSLHETEFIAPTTRDGRPVYLVGYLFEREGCSLPWRQALGRLQAGGERTYGWGRLALHEQPTESDSLFDQCALQLSGSQPGLTVVANNHLLAHALASGDRAVSARGRLAPLVGRETASAADHGRNVALTAICWEPGSVVTADATFAVGPYGVWEAAAI